MIEFVKKEIGLATLYCGDCFEVVPSLSSFDAIITDPPYAIPTMVASGREVVRNAGDLSLIECAFRQHMKLWKGSIGDAGRVFVFCDGTSYPVVFRAAYGIFNTALLIWDKKKIGMGREFRKRHELILHAWASGTEVISSDGVGYSDVITNPPVPPSERYHPAEKPVGLIDQLLRVCGQDVLDPFMGSGSTGVACVKSGRRFTGIEINQDYFDVACKRIEDAQSLKVAA